MAAVVAAVIVQFSLASAEEEAAKTDFMFWSRMTMGKVVASTLERGYDLPFQGEVLEKIDGGIKITRVLSPTLTGRFNFGVVVNAASVSPKLPTNEYSTKRVGPVLLDATLEYRRGGLLARNDTLLAELGYFPFKYNPQSTNLGEYLFRSGTYPGWLISGFEHSIDRPKLGGVHLAHVLGSSVRLRQDLIVNTELDVYPYHDINLTYIATPSFGKLFNFSLGVEFARLIAVDPPKTTLGLDPFYRNRYDAKIGYIDTTTGDTIRYTFKGTKLMCRGTLDFKEFFGGANGFFGKEDLKFYGEAAWLGVKNYAGWYEEPKERVPAMLGFNWPTHQLLSYSIVPGIMAYALEPVRSKKALRGEIFGATGVFTAVGTWLMDRFWHWNTKLDVISIEVERYAFPYTNTQDYIWKGTSAIPYISDRPSTSYPEYNRDWNDSLAQTDDDIRWSVYVSKRIGNHVRLSAQTAYDHTPKTWYTPVPSPQSAKYSDMVPRKGDWYFMMRMSLYF